MIKLAGIFQNGMVLQRRKPIRIWGSTDKTQKVQIFLDEELLLEHKLTEGDFSIELPAQEAAWDVNLKFVEADGTELLLAGVDIGEVWIAGGQSNMEFILFYDREGDEMIEKAEDEHYRFYDVGRFAFEGEREEGLKKDAVHWDKWVKYCKEDAPWFSAAGTYFARILRKELEVPVGIVGCNWGGTSASSWIDADILRADKLLKVYTDAYDKRVAKLDMEKYRRENRKEREQIASEQAMRDRDIRMKVETIVPPAFMVKLNGRLTRLINSAGPHSDKRPGGLYEMMLKQIVGFTCQGVIWYQGESDDMYPDMYARLFTKLIQCWRKDWKEELPFLFTQLAPFEEWLGCSGKNYPIIREQQQMVEDSVENVWMTSIMDAGSRYDIHPKDKRPVGERLAFLALGKIYGKTGCCQAPRMEQILRKENQIHIVFAHAPNGLETKKGLIDLFEVKAGRKPIAVSAKVSGNEVILTLPDKIKKKTPLMISFAYQPYCEMVLWNTEGFAARPFAPIEI